MKKITTVILLVFSAVANSAPPKSANQHDQNSVKNPSGQNGNQHLKDSVIKRNPGGEYHEQRGKRDKNGSNATDPHREIVTVPLLSW